MSASSSQPTYAPWQFTQYIVALEGNNLACIFSGIYFAIAGVNLYLLQKKRDRVLLRIYTAAQLVTTLVFVVIAIYSAPDQCLGVFGIVPNNGPEETSPWPAVAVNVAFAINTWISDGFLLYRCYVFCLGNMYAMAFPIVLYLATVGSSTAWLIVSSVPGAVYSTRAVKISTILYWSFSTAMTVCASFLISIRLWMHRNAISKYPAIASKRGGFYLKYMMITLESALLYAVFAVVTLVVWTVNNPVVIAFIPVLGVIQAIAPSLIIYCIARGISFKTDTYDIMAPGHTRFASSGAYQLPQQSSDKTCRVPGTPHEPLHVINIAPEETSKAGTHSLTNVNWRNPRENDATVWSGYEPRFRLSEM